VEQTGSIEPSRKAGYRSPKKLAGLQFGDTVLLWLTLFLWIALFLIGTLINSAPFRARFASFEGGLTGTVKNGLVVVVAYTMPNVALLCMMASLLGAIGARARLGSDTQDAETAEQDITSPRSSAVLRGFLVYLTLISGVIVFAETPAEPTQAQYVKLAGVMSVVAFLVSYRPTLFGRLLERGGRFLSGSQPNRGGGP
jgi:hypothetical protein